MNDKLQGAITLKVFSGKAQAEAPFEMLKMWNITDKVRKLVFGSTASISFRKNGPAKLVEDMFIKKMF